MESYYYERPAILQIILVIFSLMSIAGLWKTFGKLGEKKWASIIPFYNNWCLYRQGGLHPFLSVIGSLCLIFFFPLFFYVSFAAGDGVNVTFLVLRLLDCTIGIIIYIIMGIYVLVNIGKKFQLSSSQIFLLVVFTQIMWFVIGFNKNIQVKRDSQ